MLLKELLKNIAVKKIIGDIENIKIDFLCDNTKKLVKGSLFVAIIGLRVDSHNFLEEAVKCGAVAVVVEKEQINLTVPQIIVENSRITLSKLAGNFYKDTLKQLKIISVIGTNGKTTTSYLIKDILRSAGFKVGLIGTNGILINEEKLSSTLTTPDTLDLFLLFEKMWRAGVKIVVMEISAHAIYLNKINGFVSDIAVFTNLSKEHLDFFKSVEQYKNCKMGYFTKEFCKLVVVNRDDKVGKELLEKNNIKIVSYGFTKKSHVFCTKLEMSLKKSKFLLNCENEIKEITFNLPAKFNVYNALAAACACYYFGLTSEEVKKGLNVEHKIDGRFNFLVVDKNSLVIIDFAHTPAAILNLLKTIKALSNKKIICVFGCPGSRDQLKRSVMGNIAGKFCDYCLITSDNPDIENPLIILNQVKRGLCKTKTPYEIIEDRKEAIKRAFIIKEQFKEANIVLLGKGAENYQIINGVQVPYNDERQVLELLKK